MDQVHVVRYQVLVEGRSQRHVAKALGISRVTVRKYLEQAALVRKPKTESRGRPVWEKVAARVDAVLAESAEWTGGKQRLTATRLHRLLREEGHEVGVTLIKTAVAEWKRRRREVFIPLTYRPGDLAEVDFFEVLVDVDGTRQKAWLFLLRLMYAGRDFAWIYERQDQVSFLDGHVRAFAHLAGIPARLAYDNLRPAVTRILVGGERALTARFAALASHYVFEPCFCRPATGHDKGGVEARGKGIRGQLLVPIPSGPTLDAINGTLLAGLDARLSEGRDVEGQTIGDRWAQEQPHLRAVPPPFLATATTVCGVSPRALASGRTPCRSIIRSIAALRPRKVVLDREIVALTADGRPSLQALQHRTTPQYALTYCAFDLLSLNGTSWLRRPLEAALRRRSRPAGRWEYGPRPDHTAAIRV